jgi:mono/diheme cytochrome c family protein
VKLLNVTAVAFALVAIAGSSGLTAAPATPTASYTTEQAYRGRLQYYESCAECHGGKLEGVFGPALADGDDNLQYQAVKDVYGYMSTHMPHGNPMSLTDDQYVAIMAFLMQSHGLPAGSQALTKRAVMADTTLMGNGR